MASIGENSEKSVCELIAVCSADHRLRFVSRSFAGFFGAAIEQWLGRQFAPGGGAASDGHPHTYKTAVPGRHGERVIEWTETALVGGERLYVGKTNAPDGGESAQSEGECSLKFLATMSHEMRTPLNGIIGMNALLIDTALEPNQRAYAESVRETGAPLLALIHDLLD